MNILFFIVIIILIGNIIGGFKKGMIREILSLITLIIICVMLALIGNGISSYFDKRFANMIIAVVLLAVLIVVHQLINLVFFPAKLVAKLPVINWVDKACGIIIGIFETVLMLWTLYTFVMLMDLGMIGEQVKIFTKENNILLWFYENNYLAYFLETISSKITFL